MSWVIVYTPRVSVYTEVGLMSSLSSSGLFERFVSLLSVSCTLASEWRVVRFASNSHRRARSDKTVASASRRELDSRRFTTVEDRKFEI